MALEQRVSPPEDERNVRGRFTDDSIVDRLPLDWDRNTGWSERSHFGGLINVLHSYCILRILAENRVNLDSDVTWQYGPLVDNLIITHIFCDWLPEVLWCLSCAVS